MMETYWKGISLRQRGNCRHNDHTRKPWQREGRSEKPTQKREWEPKGRHPLFRSVWPIEAPTHLTWLLFLCQDSCHNTNTGRLFLHRPIIHIVLIDDSRIQSESLETFVGRRGRLRWTMICQTSTKPANYSEEWTVIKRNFSVMVPSCVTLPTQSTQICEGVVGTEDEGPTLKTFISGQYSLNTARKYLLMIFSNTVPSSSYIRSSITSHYSRLNHTSLC